LSESELYRLRYGVNVRVGEGGRGDNIGAVLK
jgi:hypothetical protein